MSDEAIPSSPAEANDPIQNLKGEFNRKLGGLESQVSSLAALNQQLLSKLDGLSKPAHIPQGSSTEDFTNVLFERPKEFIDKFQQSVSQQIDQRISGIQQQASEQTQVLSNLYDQYPELQNPSSELTKKAIEIQSGMSAEERRNPKMLRVAALEAAAELGVQPKRKRPVEDQDAAFAPSSLNGKFSDREMPRSMKQAEAATMELAELMGLNVSDKKVKDSLKDRLKKYSR